MTLSINYLFVKSYCYDFLNLTSRFKNWSVQLNIVEKYWTQCTIMAGFFVSICCLLDGPSDVIPYPKDMDIYIFCHVQEGLSILYPNTHHIRIDKSYWTCSILFVYEV